MLTGAMAADVDTAGDRARDLGEDCVEGNVCKNGARHQGTVHGLVEQLAGFLAARAAWPATASFNASAAPGLIRASSARTSSFVKTRSGLQE
jgi:hypothetical protein